MGFKLFTPVKRGGVYTTNPETYVAKKDGKVYTRLNSAAMRMLGGQATNGQTSVHVRLYVDPEGHQGGFEPCAEGEGHRLTSSNSQFALNQAMEAAGLKPDVYTLEAVDLLPVRFRIRGKVVR